MRHPPSCLCDGDLACLGLPANRKQSCETRPNGDANRVRADSRPSCPHRSSCEKSTPAPAGRDVGVSGRAWRYGSVVLTRCPTVGRHFHLVLLHDPRASEALANGNDRAPHGGTPPRSAACAVERECLCETSPIAAWGEMFVCREKPLSRTSTPYVRRVFHTLAAVLMLTFEGVPNAVPHPPTNAQCRDCRYDRRGLSDNFILLDLQRI